VTARLARWAEWRRARGVRGALSRWAWHRLVHAGNAGNQAAIDAIWHLWLRDPAEETAEETWELLSGRRSGSWLRRAAFEAAVDPDRPPAAREAIGRFCGRHGLALDDAAEQAAFFVLTGQAGSHRAVDPDGSLLVSAYEAATAVTRAALRRTVIAAGDLRLVRALTGRCGAEMTGAEIDDLARRFAGERAWADLRRLARVAPLPQAVTAARLLDGRRPDDEAERRLLDRLAAMDRDRVETLAAACVVPIRIDGPMVHGVAFAPDASQIVLATSTDISIYSLPDGRHVRTTPRRAEGFGRPLGGGVVHLGDDVVYAERHDKRRLRDGSGDLGDWWVMYWRPPSSVGLVWPKHAATFVSVQPTYHPVRFVVMEERLLQFASREGEERIAPADLGLAGRWIFADLATEPVRGRIAVVVRNQDDDRRDLLLMSSDLQVIARAGGAARTAGPVAFHGPDRLLTVDGSDRSLKSWRASGGSLSVVATAEDGGRVAPLPAMDVVAVDRDGTVTWRDGETLAPVDGPATLRSRWPSYVSPGEEYVAVGTGAGVDVYDLRRLQLAELIARPVPSARPGDMAAVAALARHDLGPAAVEVLAVHRARLEHRLT
jgi:hypothetical protein